jgi:hypothetical protein
MKTTIKQTTLACALLLAAGLSHADSKQDDTIATESRTVAPFTAINIMGPFRVIVTPQGGNTVQLSGLKRQFAEIETSVNGDTLTVRQPRQKKGWTINFGWGKDSKPPMTIRISAAGLKSLRNGGSGDVELQQFQGQALSITSDGSGDLNASGAVRDLSVTASGSGDLNLRGLKTANLQLWMNGSGDVDTGAVTQDLNLRVNGSGDLDAGDVHGGRITASLHGSGSVRLQGTAQEIVAQLHSSGDLDACSLAVEAATAQLHGSGEACLSGSDQKARRRSAQLGRPDGTRPAGANRARHPQRIGRDGIIGQHRQC